MNSILIDILNIFTPAEDSEHLMDNNEQSQQMSLDLWVDEDTDE